MASRSGDDSQRHNYTFKVLVIGESGTGKSCLVQRYVHKYFSENFRATIGVDFAIKVIKTDDGTIVRVQLWDIAGQERFGKMMRVYYREAVGCIIVFDVTKPSTFDAVSKWKTDLDNKVQLRNGERLPCILLANKCDLPHDGLVNNVERMNNYCLENGFDKWFETSAKENRNIDTAIQYLISEILKHTEGAQDNTSGGDSDKVQVSGTPSNNGSGSGCCG